MPKVKIRPFEMSLAELDSALNHRRLDLALTYDMGQPSYDCASAHLAAMPPRALVAAHHPLAANDKVQLSDLKREPYVMLDGPGSRDYFERLFAQLGLAPRISFSSSSMETVRSAVAAGLGYTFLAMQPPTSSTYDGARSNRSTLLQNFRI